MGAGSEFGRIEALYLWACLAMAALCGLTARLGWRLFSPSELPPLDPEARAQWALKRRWIAISELTALPAFATGWIMAGEYLHLSVPLMVLGSMLSGVLGFGFLLHALQVIVTRKVGG